MAGTAQLGRHLPGRYCDHARYNVGNDIMQQSAGL